MEYLDEKLYQYSTSEFYPFHMPGHKRQMKEGNLGNPYRIDVTEITDFDNLHHAEGILKENQEAAAQLYGAKSSYFLVNGSTAGLLAAVSACTTRRGKLLMARNCHKAVYHGAYLRELATCYLYPALNEELGLAGGISPEEVEKALQKDPGIQAVLITSPTYDGIVSPVREIAEVCHRYEIPLLVDEAHGAHFPFYEGFPESALKEGADLVVQSLHKTLPALTQTAILHCCSDRIDQRKLEQFLGIYQSSSPSYVLMAGISACLRYLKEQGKEPWHLYMQRVDRLRASLKNMRCLQLLDEEIVGKGSVRDLDRSKLVVFTSGTGITGPELHRKLREKFFLEMEMEAEQYVLALTSVMDTEEGFKRLENALLCIDRELSETQKAVSGDFFREQESGSMEQVLTISDAMESPGEEILLADSPGKISAEYIYLYPPGIPLLVPGERITEKFWKRIGQIKARGLSLQGLKDYGAEKITVVKE